MYSPTEIKALVFVPMATGTFSLIGSSGLIIMILWFSRIKITAAVRRLLLGLCVYDVILSLTSVATTFPIPPGQGFYGASGTVGTCDVQGFLSQMGASGSVLYNCSLSVYYVSVIKFGMREKAFMKKIEFWCHFIPNAFAICSSIFLQVGGYFNPMNVGVTCWISAVPTECLHDSDVDCTRGGKKALVYRKWLGVYLFSFGACVVILNMALIIHSVLAQKKKSDQNRLRGANDSNTSAGGSRILGYFLRVASCLGYLFTPFPLKWCVGGEDNSSKNSDAQALALNEGNGATHTQQDNISSGCAKNAVTENNDPLPFLKVPSEPAEMLVASPTLHKHKSSQVKSNEGDEENGLSSVTSKSTRAPPSRTGTVTDPYKFNTAKVRASFKRESLIGPMKCPSQLPAQDKYLEDMNTLFAPAASKPRAPPSRTGTGADPYKFDTAKVRARIRRESLSLPALDDVDLQRSRFQEDTTAAPVTGQSEPDSGHYDEIGSPNNNNNNSSVEKEVISQALLYMGCFVLTYIFSIIGGIFLTQGKEVPFIILLLARFFLPLQGFFNIIVYTRPHIVSLRRNNPEYSWFKAFAIVFKAGGDNDSAGQSARSNQQPASDANIRRRQTLVERDHNRRMSEIRRRSMVSDSFLAAAREARLSDELQRLSGSSKIENDSNGNIEMLDVDEELGSACAVDPTCARQENDDTFDLKSTLGHSN